MAHPGHLGVVFQVLGHRQSIGTVARHAQAQRLQADVEIVGVLRGGNRAEVPHELSRSLGDERPRQTEALGVGHPVVALVGGAQARELIGVFGPVKLPAVHDGAAHGVGVTVHVLCGGVGHDVRAELKGPAVDGGGKGVVDDEGHAMVVGRLGKALNVQHGERGVGHALPENRLGIGAESSGQLIVGAVGGDKRKVDPHALHGHGKEVEGPAVDGGGGHHMVAAGGDVEHGVEVGRLA